MPHQLSWSEVKAYTTWALGKELTDEALALILAKTAIETGLFRFFPAGNGFDAVASYIDACSTGQYKRAWAALLTGDPRAYLRQLKLAGFFAGPEDDYAAGVVNLMRLYLARIKNEPEPMRFDIYWDRILASVPSLQFSVADLLGDSN